MQALARFSQPDPIAGSADIPQSLNQYVYVQNDPVNATDPLGLKKHTVCEFLDAECSICITYDDQTERTTESIHCNDSGPPAGENPVGGREDIEGGRFPDLECEVSVRFKPLSGIAAWFDGWHAYIVTTELKDGTPNSRPHYYRAGPRGKFPRWRIYAQGGIYDSRTPDWTTEFRPNVTFKFPGSCTHFDMTFRFVTDEVNKRNLIYGIVFRNSNSFVYTALKYANLSISREQLDSLPIGWLPGWGQDLLGVL